MKFFFALILLIISYRCNGVNVHCEYKDDEACDDCLSYACEVQNEELVISKDDREITAVEGAHESGKSDDDVKGFDANAIVVRFFPRGVTKYFKNIENVRVASAELQEITKEDLKEFGGNLRKLWFGGNKIEKIDGDLFEFNENLEDVTLSFNRIMQIDDGAFNGLNDLKFLFLFNNPCTDSDDFVANNHTKVLKLIENVKEKCKN